MSQRLGIAYERQIKRLSISTYFYPLNSYKVSGVYIHIPFCRKACIYCDFYFSVSLELKEQFVAALLQEIEIRKNYLSEPVQTIYFGGGTPSVLSAEEINMIDRKSVV